MSISWDNGAPVRREGPEAPLTPDLPPRPLFKALTRGLLTKCPACGVGSIFASYLKVDPACGACGEALHHQRADDAPPYFSIFIVGHIVVAAVLYVELWFAPPLWVHLSLWMPLTFGLVILSLPPIKGALIGQQWALYMHGFGEAASDAGADGGETPRG